MSREIAAFTAENEKLKRTSTSKEMLHMDMSNNNGLHEYFTDEEELARETEWILNKSKKNMRGNYKKRKAEFSLELELSKNVTPVETKKKGDQLV